MSEERNLMVQWEGWNVDLFLAASGSLGLTIEHPSTAGMPMDEDSGCPSVDIFVDQDLHVRSDDTKADDPVVPSPADSKALEYLRGLLEVHDAQGEANDSYMEEIRRYLADGSAMTPEQEEVRNKVMTYSDYHKDFYGHRPKWIRSWTTDQEIAAAYDQISAAFNEKKSTLEGRQWLRSTGWQVPEPGEVKP